MSAQALAPWLQVQLAQLLPRRGHAILLSGPSGLGQYELALALASSWLCEQPTAHGACGQCTSCHTIAARTHPDLCVLLPENLSQALGWNLDDESAPVETDGKKRKPSREIRVDAVRQAVQFTQLTGSGGVGKVVLVYPAERMNAVAANALLKTLEEPPAQLRFVLATEAAEQLLPTIRSRCQTHSLVWPAFDEALAWLQQACAQRGLGGKNVQQDDLRVLLQAAGGRPADVLTLLAQADARHAAAQWLALPQAISRGQASAMAAFTPAQAIEALQKLCHDMWALKLGAAPRFFPADALSVTASAGSPAGARRPAAGPTFHGLGQWARALTASARTAEHPYNPGLMLEALVSQARRALGGQ